MSVPRPQLGNATGLLHQVGLGYSLFARRYSGSRVLLSVPQGTEMFQFPWFPLPALWVQAGVTRHDPCQVFPFGDPRINACLAAPRGLSQPATSFFGFQRQGIHRVPFATCRDDARARYGVLKGRPGMRARRLRGRPTSPARRGLAGAAWFARTILSARLGRPEGTSATFKATQCAQRPHRSAGPVMTAERGPPGLYRATRSLSSQ